MFLSDVILRKSLLWTIEGSIHCLNAVTDPLEEGFYARVELFHLIVKAIDFELQSIDPISFFFAPLLAFLFLIDMIGFNTMDGQMRDLIS